MKELYVAVSGAVSREKQMAMIANNLANVNSAGYKRQQAVFEVRPPDTDFEALERSASPRLNLPEVTQRIEGDRNYVRVADSYTDFSQGVLKPTGKVFDMALETWGDSEGTAFFALRTAEGVRYTRMGNFLVDGQGRLSTPEGHLPLDTGGSPIEIGENRNIAVGPDGTISAGGEELGSLEVRIFDNPRDLLRLGHGLYGDREGAVQGRARGDGDNVTVRSGYLELSNVNAVDELVRMIDVQRSYQTFQKAMTTMDEASGRLITSVMNG